MDIDSVKRLIIELSPGAGILSRIIQQAVVFVVDNNIDYDEAYFTFGAYGIYHNNDPYLIPLAEVVNEELNIMMINYGIDNPYAHITNYAFDQKIEDFHNSPVLVTGPPQTHHGKNNPIEFTEKFLQYKQQFKRLKFRKEILDQVELRCKDMQVNENTLSVHCRMTTLSRMFGNQHKTTEEYFSFVDSELKLGTYSNIFLSSDNDESIIKFKSRYGNLLQCNEDFKCRYPEEKTESGALEFKYLFRKYNWVETLTDMFMLSRGSAIIGRYSYFTNAAIVASNSIKKIIRIDFGGDGL